MRLDRVIAVRNDKTIYRDGDRCVKVFDETYSKADILNEALNQARIEETGLKIPKLIEVTTIDGRWTIVSEFIKGKTLDRLIFEQPQKKESYIDLLVELQMQIHEKTCPLLNKLKDKMIRYIAETDFDANTRYELHTRLESMPRQNRVCHGDFNPSNVVISDTGDAYILDWAHATQGDSSADAAMTYLSFELEGDEASAKYYLDSFCEKSVVKKQSVQTWLPLVAAAQSLKKTKTRKNGLWNWQALPVTNDNKDQ